MSVDWATYDEAFQETLHASLRDNWRRVTLSVAGVFVTLVPRQRTREEEIAVAHDNLGFALRQVERSITIDGEFSLAEMATAEDPLVEDGNGEGLTDGE